jgi:hypothetical protein
LVYAFEIEVASGRRHQAMHYLFQKVLSDPNVVIVMAPKRNKNRAPHPINIKISKPMSLTGPPYRLEQGISSNDIYDVACITCTH